MRHFPVSQTKRGRNLSCIYPAFIFIFAIAALFAGSDALAIPYSNIGSGTSTVGPNVGDDYPTLYAAAEAVTTAATRTAGGDWTFLITGDITEPMDAVFRAYMGTSTITIRPAPSVTATLDYSTATTFGPAAHIVVGRSTSPNINTKTDNITIDGSNVPGGTSRDLTITAGARRVIGILGDSDFLTVKNCVLNNRGFLIQALNGPLAPDNGLVENCQINIVAADNTVTAAVANTINGWEFRDCEFNHTGGQRLFTMNNMNFTFLRCTINYTANSGTGGQQGFWWDGVATGTFDSCTINYTHIGTGANSGGGFFTRYGAGTTNLYNNFVNIVASGTANMGAGMNILELDTALSATVNDATVVGYNNSIYARSTTTPGSTVAPPRFGVVRLTSGFSGRLDWQNNVMKNSVATAGSPSYMLNHPGTGGTITSDQNLVYVDPLAANANFGVWGGTDYATRSDWNTASGQDANSAEPAVDPDGFWVSNADYHFTTEPTPADTAWIGTPIGVITEDIDGNSRHPLEPTRGAVESTVLDVNDWPGF